MVDVPYTGLEILTAGSIFAAVIAFLLSSPNQFRPTTNEIKLFSLGAIFLVIAGSIVFVEELGFVPEFFSFSVNQYEVLHGITEVGLVVSSICLLFGALSYLKTHFLNFLW